MDCAGRAKRRRRFGYILRWCWRASSGMVWAGECKAVSSLRSATAVQNAREVRQVLECGSPLLLNFECNSGATGFYFEAMRTRIVGRVPRPVALPPGVAFICLLALSLSLVAAPYTPRRTGNFDFP